MGLAQFVQQFLDDGLFYLNSGYLSIKSSAHIHTRSPKVSIGEHWMVDLERLNERINKKQGEILPEAQIVWDRGINGPFVDVTAPTSVDGRGWGW